MPTSEPPVASNTPPEEAGAECYVCFEALAPKSPCKCIGRYLHVECQRRQVEQTGRAECAVCKEPYPNVKCVTKTSRCVTRRGLCFQVLVALFMVATMLVSCRVAPSSGGGYWLLEASFTSVFMSVVGTILALELVFYARGAWRLLEVRSVHTVSTVVIELEPV